MSRATLMPRAATPLGFPATRLGCPATGLGCPATRLGLRGSTRTSLGPRPDVRPTGIQVLVAVAVGAWGLTSCSGALQDVPTPSVSVSPAALPTASPTPAAAAVDPWISLIATGTGLRIEVFASAGSTVVEQTVSVADAASFPDQIPLTFLVVGQDGDWLEVLLPVPPAGSTGWVRAADVTVSTTDLRLEVRLGEHRLLLHQADQVALDVPLALGSGLLPVPGRYFVTELLQPPGSVAGSGSVYGAFVYGLSGYPPLLASLAAGQGITGIHGTGDPAGLGADATPGSVRILDADIARLVQEFGLPLGTPVDVVA